MIRKVYTKIKAIEENKERQRTTEREDDIHQEGVGKLREDIIKHGYLWGPRNLVQSNTTRHYDDDEDDDESEKKKKKNYIQSNRTSEPSYSFIHPPPSPVLTSQRIQALITRSRTGLLSNSFTSWAFALKGKLGCWKQDHEVCDQIWAAVSHFDWPILHLQ